MQRAKQRENKLEAMRQKARRIRAPAAPRAACAARLLASTWPHASPSPRAQLRKACLARVRASRTELLASLRARGAAGDAAHVDDGPELGAHLRQLLAEELHRGADGGMAGARLRAPAGRVWAVTWPRGPLTAPRHCADAWLPGAQPPGGSGDAHMSAEDALWVRWRRDTARSGARSR